MSSCLQGRARHRDHRLTAEDRFGGVCSPSGFWRRTTLKVPPHREGLVQSGSNPESTAAALSGSTICLMSQGEADVGSSGLVTAGRIVRFAGRDGANGDGALQGMDPGFTR